MPAIKFQSLFAVGMMMDSEAHHAYDWQIDRFSGCIMIDVDRQADLRNSALPVLADARIYRI